MPRGHGDTVCISRIAWRWQAHSIFMVSLCSGARERPEIAQCSPGLRRAMSAGGKSSTDAVHIEYEEILPGDIQWSRKDMVGGRVRVWLRETRSMRSSYGRPAGHSLLLIPLLLPSSIGHAVPSERIVQHCQAGQVE